MSKQIQVKDLYEACKKQVDKGNGDKYIVVANDNEGNGYHGMFFQFTEISQMQRVFDDPFMLHDSKTNDLNKIIILG